MRFVPIFEFDVDVRTEVCRKALEKFTHQNHVKITNHMVGEGDLIDEEGTVADVEYDACKAFIHGQKKKTIATNALLVTQGLLEGETKYDARVLDRVVVINAKVTRGLYPQIYKAVPCKKRQHVVEERDASFNTGLARPVEVEVDFNLCLGGFPAEICYAVLGTHVLGNLHVNAMD